jgi:hypothetical protein
MCPADIFPIKQKLMRFKQFLISIKLLPGNNYATFGFLPWAFTGWMYQCVRS